MVVKNTEESKNMKKLLVLALTAVLAMNIAGCGKASEEAAKKEVEAEVTEAAKEIEAADAEREAVKAAEDEAEAVKDEAEDIAKAGDSSAVMDLYIKASEASFKAMAEEVKDTMEFTVSGEGSTLKYTFKLLIDIGDKAAAKAALDEEAPAQEENMQMALSAMKMTGIENPEIVLEYLDMNGEKITSYTFK